VEVSTVCDAIARLRRAGAPLVVGIDGFGGAGKSTLATAVATQLGDAVVVAMDDFIVKERVDDDSWERVWDRARLRADVLDPFRAGRSVAFRRLLWDENALSEPIELGTAGILIVEGITALHPELAGSYDHSVWVDTPLEIATARGRARDAGNENEGRWERWALNDRRYLEAHRPDLVAHQIWTNR
jgi:uridine kinase